MFGSSKHTVEEYLHMNFQKKSAWYGTTTLSYNASVVAVSDMYVHRVDNNCRNITTTYQYIYTEQNKFYDCLNIFCSSFFLPLLVPILSVRIDLFCTCLEIKFR